MSNLDELFCHVDDWTQQFEPLWKQKLLSHDIVRRVRPKSLCLSEIMTILMAFHQNHYRNFKHFYLNHVKQFWNSAFPKLPTYHRFIEWVRCTIIPLSVYLKHCFGHCTGISFIDSTKIQVCHNRRISRHKVFKHLAARGKTSVDWFFGFQLHLVVNEFGEIINMTLTAGNIDDRKPVVDL